MNKQYLLEASFVLICCLVSSFYKHLVKMVRIGSCLHNITPVIRPWSCIHNEAISIVIRPSDDLITYRSLNLINEVKRDNESNPKVRIRCGAVALRKIAPARTRTHDLKRRPQIKAQRSNRLRHNWYKTGFYSDFYLPIIYLDWLITIQAQN